MKSIFKKMKNLSVFCLFLSFFLSGLSISHAETAKKESKDTTVKTVSSPHKNGAVASKSEKGKEAKCEKCRRGEDGKIQCEPVVCPK